MNKKKINFLFTFIKITTGILISVFFLHVFIFHSSIVQGESMLPVMKEGDRIIFNKAAYLFEEPKRGDIVIIHRPIKNYVKRIIALPGETVEVKENKLLINGERFKQSYLPEKEAKKTTDFGPVTIPENSYFVMGDNRLISKDSRNGLGFVAKEEIIGRSEMVFSPFTEFSIIK